MKKYFKVENRTYNLDLSFTLKMVWKRKSDISPLESGPVHPHIRKVKYPLQDCVGVSISWNNDTEKVTCEYLWTFWLRGWELPKFPNSSKWTREVWELLKFHAKVKDMLCFHGCNPYMSSAEKFKYVHVFFLFHFIILGQRQL